MTHFVEDFSVEVPVTNPNITDQYTEKVDLKRYRNVSQQQVIRCKYRNIT